MHKEIECLKKEKFLMDKLMEELEFTNILQKRVIKTYEDQFLSSSSSTGGMSRSYSSCLAQGSSNQQEEVNIICVDWSNGAALPNYVKASANTRLVGKQLSLLLRGLVEKNGLSLRHTHLIGFSLGAHIAGFAGADLGNLSRITGLDPAGPLFEAQDPRARLDETDAAFVDVIHSNGENLILGGLGSSQPMGHVDFFPNGGRMQKGCSHLFVGAVTDIIWSTAVEGRSLCNHRRAYKFFIDSISPRCHFPAFPCGSYDDFLAGKCFPCTEGRQCGNMGYYADRSKGRGQLYLITRDEEPFCAHQYLVKLESLPNPLPVKSYGKIQITVVGESLLNETFMMTRKEDEEMTLGQSISRIIVPHPILAQPTRIEILYTAYSGWLSSGLAQWRLDKVTLMDSFGKMSSVCKKNLILRSGVPVLLPLYPGECNLPKDPFEATAEDRIEITDDDEKLNDTDKRPNFTPTQVVRVGLEDKDDQSDKPSLFRDAMGIFNIPWSNDKENDILDTEASESSRAFNTRIIKVDNAITTNEDGLVKEIVEPILKPHSNKNARSHDPDRDKVEITEPILGPTTAKNIKSTTTVSTTTTTTTTTKAPTVELRNEEKSSVKISFDNDWVPKQPTKPKPEVKRKRQDESKVMTGFERPSLDPLDSFATTVQFLPQRLARMFQQAEKYARDNILPLVSTYTPRFIADMITPRDTTPKYVPLQYDETTTRKSPKPKAKSISDTEKPLFEVSESRHVVVEKQFEPVTDPTTPYTHIQKLTKKTEQEEAELKAMLKASTKAIMMSTTSIPDSTPTIPVPTTASTKRATPAATKEYNRRARDDNNVSSTPKLRFIPVTDHTTAATNDHKAIYIDLPVFDNDSFRKIKYIPLVTESE
nr:unnamed protein product [Callosobruchus analis]